MKSTKTILAVAIVIAGLASFGCGGNPCEDQLTEDAQTAILAVFEIQLLTTGYITWNDNVFFDTECGDYLADIVLGQ